MTLKNTGSPEVPHPSQNIYNKNILSSKNHCASSKEQSMMDKALAIAQMGLPVFPVFPLYMKGGKLQKIPAVYRFPSIATTNPDTIRQMWSGTYTTQKPGKKDMIAPKDSAIGISTNGLCVLDVDVKDPKVNVADSLKKLPCISTLVSQTLTGGYHFFLFLPQDVEVKSVTALLPGIDVRGYGGFVVAPGSSYKGKEYSWVNDRPIAMITPELLKKIPLRQAKPMENPFGIPMGVNREPLMVSAGSRDNDIFKICSSYRAKGFARAEAETLLRAVFDKIEQPEGDPFTWQDCLAKLDQAWNYPEGSVHDQQAAQLVQSTNETEWEKPIGLEESKVPKFDDDILPGTLGEMIRAVSIATETPIELAVGLILPVIATACQGKLFVSVKSGYQEPLCFWTVTALDSGNRKSSVLEKITAPLNEWEKNKRLEIEPQRQEAITRQKNQESRIKILRAQFSRADASDSERIEAEIINLEMYPIEIPIIPQLWAQDVTPEHLGTLMNINNERMAILSAEGGIFDIMGGRYSNGLSNLDLFLQAHSGDSVRVDRGSRDPVYLDKPALSLGLSPQPDVLRSLAEKQGFRGRGLLARFQYLLPKSKLGYRKLTSEPVPEEIEKKYQNLIYKLLDIELAENKFDASKVPYIIKLSQKAYDRWFDFSKEVEKDLREGGRFEHITDWAGKFPGMTARIAGLLHCAENPDQPWKGKINFDLMERSIKIALFLSDHALVAFELIGADKTFVQARKIWRWVERHRHQSFSKRDCFDALKGSFKKVANMEEPLKILIERNYIKEFSKPTGGRPSLGYDVNPEIIKGWDE